MVDPHVHTLASIHAYSTVNECIQAALEKGLRGIVITDHAKRPAAAIDGDFGYYDHFQHFFNLKVIPPYVNGIRVFRGVEVDILDLGGTLVFPNRIIELFQLEVVIASVHPDVPIGKPWETKSQHTEAYIRVLENPLVDILGHSGTPEFSYDIDKVLLTAKRLDKMIEVNNSTFTVRPQSLENCKKIALRCKELGVYITIGSDAHVCYDVGRFDAALKMLREIDFPEALIANASLERFIGILNKRKNIAI